MGNYTLLSNTHLQPGVILQRWRQVGELPWGPVTLRTVVLLDE